MLLLLSILWWCRECKWPKSVILALTPVSQFYTCVSIFWRNPPSALVSNHYPGSWVNSQPQYEVEKKKKKKTKSHQLSSWSRLSVAGRPRAGSIQGPGCQPCLYRLTVPPLVSATYSLKQLNYLLTKTTLKLSIEDIIQNSITILKMCQVIFLLMVLLLF